MATAHEIVGQEWADRAADLAQWAMDNLVNRKDLWGQYSVLTPSEARRSKTGYRAMTLPQKSMRTGADMVTLDKLTRHFASRRERKPQIIGLHAKSEENTSRWFAIDIDCHDTDAPTAEDHARRNLAAALEWVDQLHTAGYDPLLFDSNFAGGYHIWCLLREPAPTEDVFAYVYSLVNQWERLNLDEEPETFPKKLKPRSMGSWFRLPGLHHTRDHYSRVYSGDDWLSDPWLAGHAAIDAMLGVVPGPPPPKAQEDAQYAPRTTRHKKNSGPNDLPKAPSRKASTRRSKQTASARPTICVDLDGVLASRAYRGKLDELGDPIDGAIEFTRELAQFADLIVYTARLSGAQGRGERIERAITQWLDHHGFAYNEIYAGSGKPIASAYIDDRAVPCQPETDGPQAFSTAIAGAKSLCGEIEP